MLLTVISWLVLSFGVAYLGDSRRVGFGWSLFWSLVFSPVIGFAVVMASERKGTFEEELARVKGLKNEPKPEPAKDVVEKLAQLKALHDAGALSEEEYNKAKAKLLD